MGQQRGQASVEWIALVCAVALVLGAAALGLASGYRALGPVSRIAGDAAAARDLAIARRWAPGIVFERGILDAPVDPRTCRAVSCSIGAEPVLFTHVVRRGATTYVQYWAYWPDSSWNGFAGRHADDWESFQVRINPDGTVDARASAHKGYTGRRIGPDLNVNQVRPGWVPSRWRRGWTRFTGFYRVARDSHAGFVASGPGEGRFARPQDIVLIPLAGAGLPEDYAVTPPWRKAVYTDPESSAT